MVGEIKTSQPLDSKRLAIKAPAFSLLFSGEIDLDTLHAPALVALAILYQGRDIYNVLGSYRGRDTSC